MCSIEYFHFYLKILFEKIINKNISIKTFMHTAFYKCYFPDQKLTKFTYFRVNNIDSL